MSKSDDQLEYERLKEYQRIALIAFYDVWEKEQEVIKKLQEQIEESHNRIRRMENKVETEGIMIVSDSDFLSILIPCAPPRRQLVTTKKFLSLASP